jgi:membrane glycosyltransferase
MKNAEDRILAVTAVVSYCVAMFAVGLLLYSVVQIQATLMNSQQKTVERMAFPAWSANFPSNSIGDTNERH